YANVWLTNTIVKIDPSTGIIKGILDLTTLAEKAENEYPGSLEMNGIAYDSVSGNIKITGKLWPRVYEIRLTGISFRTSNNRYHLPMISDTIKS
ncbi:MAG: glutaminyl-peptide cyclotransferase, partial [Syntrophus sp. (in: bacteria)]